MLVPSIDWSDCPLVERNPFKLGGVPILVGTRMQADSIVGNYESGSPVEEISYNFEIPEETIRQVLAFAQAQRKNAVPSETRTRRKRNRAPLYV